jgi:hypothetical protein
MAIKAMGDLLSFPCSITRGAEREREGRIGRSVAAVVGRRQVSISLSLVG